MFIIVFSIVIFGIVIALSISSVMSFNKTSRRINSNESSTNEAYSKQAKLIEIQSFNGPIELVNGKNVELLISKTLDDIITLVTSHPAKENLPIIETLFGIV